MRAHVANSDWHRNAPLESRWDRGRRIITIVKLAAGGGILATSLISIVAALGGHRTSDLIDISAALVGAAVAFGFFAARLHVFSSHAAGDELADDLHSVDME